MCGRYFFGVYGSDTEAARILGELIGCCGDGAFTGGDITPGASAPIITARDNETEVNLIRWGIPSYAKGKLIINARAETVSGKPTFKEAFENGRCLIPASGFYEWSGGKQKYTFTPENGKIIYMAGIITEAEGEKRYAVITTAANESVAAIHPRMPLILPEYSLEDWLFDKAAALELLKIKPEELKTE